jgi:hypothetical protein
VPSGLVWYQHYRHMPARHIVLVAHHCQNPRQLRQLKGDNMPESLRDYLQQVAEYLQHTPQYLQYLPAYAPESRIIIGALLGVLLAVLSSLVSRSRLTRLREAASYVIGETDRRVGLWLQLHPEKAVEPASLSRQGPLGTTDLVEIVEHSGSRELSSRLIKAVQVIVSLATLGAALHVLISKQYASNDTQWAYGIVGTVIGYWLKRI